MKVLKIFLDLFMTDIKYLTRDLLLHYFFFIFRALITSLKMRNSKSVEQTQLHQESPFNSWTTKSCRHCLSFKNPKIFINLQVVGMKKIGGLDVIKLFFSVFSDSNKLSQGWNQLLRWWISWVPIVSLVSKLTHHCLLKMNFKLSWNYQRWLINYLFFRILNSVFSYVFGKIQLYFAKTGH